MHLDSASAPRIAFRSGNPTAYIQSSSEKSCGILDVNAEILPFHVPSSQCGMDVKNDFLQFHVGYDVPVRHISSMEMPAISCPPASLSGYFLKNASTFLSSARLSYRAALVVIS